MRLSLPTAAHRLRPERPQFAVLVALLLLSFGLTSGLAWHAWSAARAEETLQDHLLEQTLRAVGRDWMYAFDVMVKGSVEQSFRGVAAPMVDAPETLSADDIGAAFRTSLTGFPPEVLDHVARTGFYTTPDGGPGSALPAQFAEWLLSVATGNTDIPIASGVYAGVRFDAPQPELGPLIYFARLDDSGAPLRVAGYRLPNEFVEAVLLVSLDQSLVAGGGVPPGIDLADVYSLSVRRQSDGFAFMEDASPTIDGQLQSVASSGIVNGLEVRTGLKPTGLTALGIPAVASARNAALITLLTSVAILIGAAGFVVRRETELSLMRARFVAGVSHELRTPLAQIRMFAETLLLGRVRTEADRRRSLEIIDQEARRLSHLVDNILMFSKADQGTVRISPEATRLSAEVATVVGDFIALPKAAGSDVRLELQEDVVVPVDTDALRQIVNNLMDNAVKYGPAGQRVTVGLALFESSARVWVDDEGPGIPAMDREQVFQSFYRLRRDEESRVGGSGIGLAVVRELATLHGGEAWAEEAPGGGARLVVSFPHAELAAATASSAAVA